MESTRRQLFTALLACAASGQAPRPPALSRAEKEKFLLTARIVKRKGAERGITGTIRATLSDGKLTHDASVQVIDDFKMQFQGTGGTEFNFKDTWKFNVAAYKLDRLLGLNMIPVYVERRFDGQPGSFGWWVDDYLMTEMTRNEKKLSPPDIDSWNNQMCALRVFDQLIFNTDRNLGNLVIDKQWQIWMIDHSRAFRKHSDLKSPGNLTKCDDALLQAMRKLDFDSLKKELSRYLDDGEIRGLLHRRDRIVAIFEQKGPQAIYTMPRRPS